MSEKRWQPGDSVILRNTGFFVGEAWATPHVVVQDSNDLVVLYRPEGTPYEIWDISGRCLTSRTTRMDMLRLMFPGRYYAVELFFDTGRGNRPYHHCEGEGRFRAWKVNIEAPFQRMDHGFDTTDHFLDIIVKPNRRYFWKDDELVAMWHSRGAYTREEVERLYEAGKELEPLIDAGASPFDNEWIDWHPAPGLALPKAPARWHEIPGIETTLGLGRAWNAWQTWR